MEKIKILHITQAFGGVETYLRQVVQNIDRNKFEIVIASPEKDTLQNFCAQNNIEHHVLDMARGVNPFGDLVSIFRIRRLIKKENPTLVHLHSSKAGFVGRIAAKTEKCKSLFTPHGVSYLSFSKFKRRVFFALELFAKRYTYKILAISHSEARRCISEIGLKEENIYIIPNSITIYDSSSPVPDKLGRLEGAMKVGTVARLTPQKNPLLFVDIAADVIKKFPEAHFYFLGAGYHDHLKKEVDERIKKYAIETSFHFINIGDHILSINFLRQIDVFVLPSVFEGLPYSLLEAMYESVPCVVSKCDGNNDVINNNINGFSCSSKEEYVERISLLLIDREKAKQIAEAGKNYVIEKHDIRNNIKLLEKIYEEI
jgi:glycosyltransferase involved in cell wall biosynthesis